MRSIAVPVPDGAGEEAGRPRLALSLGATVVLTGRGELRAHLPALRACAEEVAALPG